MGNIILPEIVSVGIFNAQRIAKNTEITKNRTTTMFEIELPIGGGGTSYIDGQSSEISENLIICAKPGQVRHTKLPFQCYYVHLMVNSGELYDRLMAIPSYVKIENREIYEKIFSQLCTHYDTSLYHDILIMQSRILELVHLLYKYVQNENFSSKSGNKLAIETAIHYIKDNLTADLSLEAMSKLTSFSPIYFHNCFKRSTGKTLREFVEDQRIQKSIDLLIRTDKTLTDIAYECGFSSQSYFSYAFKQKMNLPPREYAKKICNKYAEKNNL